ncbi:MAG: hypothetical protein ABIE68_03270 [bacterium]
MIYAWITLSALFLILGIWRLIRRVNNLGSNAFIDSACLIGSMLVIAAAAGFLLGFVIFDQSKWYTVLMITSGVGLLATIGTSYYYHREYKRCENNMYLNYVCDREIQYQGISIVLLIILVISAALHFEIIFTGG